MNSIVRFEKRGCLSKGLATDCGITTVRFLKHLVSMKRTIALISLTLGLGISVAEAVGTNPRPPLNNAPLNTVPMAQPRVGSPNVHTTPVPGVSPGTPIQNAPTTGNPPRPMPSNGTGIFVPVVTPTATPSPGA